MEIDSSSNQHASLGDRHLLSIANLLLLVSLYLGTLREEAVLQGCDSRLIFLNHESHPEVQLTYQRTSDCRCGDLPEQKRFKGVRNI